MNLKGIGARPAPRGVLTLAAALCALALAAPATATADVRYAAHDGGGADCTQASPCSLKTAIDPGVPPFGLGSTGDIEDGDTVVLLSEGVDYEIGFNLRLAVDDAITIRGEVGKPRPTIVTDANGFAPAPFLDVTEPATLEGLRIEASGDQGQVLTVRAAAAPSVVRNVYVEGRELNSSGPLMRFEGGSTLERAEIVRFASTAVTNGETLTTVGDVLLRDSIVRNTGANGAIRTNGPSTAMRIRNVTAASGSTAIFSNFEAQQVSIRNSLIAGFNTDIAAATTGAVVTVTVTRSNYDPAQVSATGAGAQIVQVAPNQDQTAPGMFPQLVDPLFGDFHQLSGSPTRNAGSPDEFTGAADIDGQLRVMGSAIDIGADEFFEVENVLPDLVPPKPKAKKRCKKGFKLKKIKRKGKKPKRKCVKKKRKKKRR